MQSLVLDTTFVLPLFGLKIKISNDFDGELKELWKNGLENYSIYLPSICLLEVIYLLNREFRKNSKSEILERYPMVLPSVVNSKTVKLFDSLIDARTAQIANNIRIQGHSDIIDCHIVATAISLDAFFLSRDHDLEKVIHSIDEYKSLKVIDWSDLIKLM